MTHPTQQQRRQQQQHGDSLVAEVQARLARILATSQSQSQDDQRAVADSVADRSRLLRWGAEHDWPAVRLTPWLTLLAGVEHWTACAASPYGDDVRQVLAALDALDALDATQATATATE